MYSKQVLDHFEHPRFAGELENATVCVDVENPACGDRLRLALRIEGDRIVEARFKAKGCVPSMACASRLAEMVSGLDVAAAETLTREELSGEFGRVARGVDARGTSGDRCVARSIEQTHGPVGISVERTASARKTNR